MLFIISVLSIILHKEVLHRFFCHDMVGCIGHFSAKHHLHVNTHMISVLCSVSGNVLKHEHVTCAHVKRQVKQASIYWSL